MFEVTYKKYFNAVNILKIDNEVCWKSSVSIILILNAFCVFSVFQHWVWKSFYLVGLLLPQVFNQEYFKIVHHMYNDSLFFSKFQKISWKILQLTPFSNQIQGHPAVRRSDDLHQWSSFYCLRVFRAHFISNLTHACACWIWQSVNLFKGVCFLYPLSENLLMFSGGIEREHLPEMG